MRSRAFRGLGSHIWVKNQARGSQMCVAHLRPDLCSTIPIKVHNLYFLSKSMVEKHVSASFLYSTLDGFSARRRLLGEGFETSKSWGGGSKLCLEAFCFVLDI